MNRSVLPSLTIGLAALLAGPASSVTITEISSIAAVATTGSPSTSSLVRPATPTDGNTFTAQDSTSFASASITKTQTSLVYTSQGLATGTSGPTADWSSSTSFSSSVRFSLDEAASYDISGTFSADFGFVGSTGFGPQYLLQVSLSKLAGGLVFRSVHSGWLTDLRKDFTIGIRDRTNGAPTRGNLEPNSYIIHVLGHVRNPDFVDPLSVFTNSTYQADVVAAFGAPIPEPSILSLTLLGLALILVRHRHAHA